MQGHVTSKVQDKSEEEVNYSPEKWFAIRHAMQQRSADNETFFAELEQGRDGFSSAAAFFGKVVICRRYRKDSNPFGKQESAEEL